MFVWQFQQRRSEEPAKRTIASWSLWQCRQFVCTTGTADDDSYSTCGVPLTVNT